MVRPHVHAHTHTYFLGESRLALWSAWGFPLTVALNAVLNNPVHNFSIVLCTHLWRCVYWVVLCISTDSTYECVFNVLHSLWGLHLNLSFILLNWHMVNLLWGKMTFTDCPDSMELQLCWCVPDTVINIFCSCQRCCLTSVQLGSWHKLLGFNAFKYSSCLHAKNRQADASFSVLNENRFSDSFLWCSLYSWESHLFYYYININYNNNVFVSSNPHYLLDCWRETPQRLVFNL